jgi:hypothetical protein
MVAAVSSFIILGIFVSAGWAVDPPKLCKSNLDCSGPNFCKMYTGMCDGPYGYCEPITINCFHGWGGRSADKFVKYSAWINTLFISLWL